MRKISTRQLVVCAILACVGGILSGSLSIHFLTWKISFGTIPVMLAGILFGPIAGGMVGFTSDIINLILKPTGAYNPLFGLSCALMGVIAGFVYKRGRREELKPSIPKTVITAGACQLICSFIINTSIMVFMYGATPALFITKIVYNLAMIPIMSILLHLLLKSVVITKLKIEK